MVDFIGATIFEHWGLILGLVLLILLDMLVFHSKEQDRKRESEATPPKNH